MAKRDLFWPDLWKAADDAAHAKVQRGLPVGRDLRTLHEQRNLAQHRGAMPSSEDIDGFVRALCARCLASCAPHSTSGTSNGLDEWDVLECEPLRNWLSDCAEAVERDEPELAIRVTTEAYSGMVSAVQKTMAGTDRMATRTFSPTSQLAGSPGSRFRDRRVAERRAEEHVRHADGHRGRDHGRWTRPADGRTMFASCDVCVVTAPNPRKMPPSW